MLQEIEKKKVTISIRSFLTKDQYDSLLKYLNSFAKFLNKEKQVIYYFSTPSELIIQKNDKECRVAINKTNSKEDIIINLRKEEFDDIVDIFEALGYEISIKWFKTLHHFTWNEMDVYVNLTKGYGYLVEMEKSVYPEEKEIILNYLRENLKLLGVDETPKEVFDERFNYYKKNWKDLV